MTTLNLINATTDQVIASLQNGDSFNLSDIGDKLNVQAIVSGGTAGSVRMSSSGPVNITKTENIAPYAMFGDASGNFNEQTFTAGSYTFEATPYSGSSASGTAGTGLTVNVTFTSGGTPPPPPPPSGLTVTSMTLINALNDQDIKTLVDGETINFDDLPTNQLNIRANVSGGTVGSVILKSAGPINFTNLENGAPYAMYSDNGGDYLPRTITSGTYTFEATPYPNANGGGNTWY